MDDLDRALATIAAADRREVIRRGYHLERRHFYTPLNDPDWLEANRDLWQPLLVPADIDWDIDAQLGVAREAAAHAHELADVPEHEPLDARDEGRAVFHWRNAFFEGADALVWYALLRARRPSRVIEVGCGWSSLLMARALACNAGGGDSSTKPAMVTQIEPFPNARVFASLPESWTHHRTPVQRVPLETFDTLGPGDVLFYDGSHCARVASDVTWMLFRVLPRLRKGVLVHLHDIFFPRDYPASWVLGRLQTWNEQYVVQALLMNSSAWRVVIANRLLADARRAELESLYAPVLGSQGVAGGSLWIEKSQDPEPRLRDAAARLTADCEANRVAKP
ncbi:MAG: class I SAM-dependent methyltransferase [Phycisphaerales bacterium]